MCRTGIRIKSMSEDPQYEEWKEVVFRQEGATDVNQLYFEFASED